MTCKKYSKYLVSLHNLAGKVLKPAELNSLVEMLQTNLETQVFALLLTSCITHATAACTVL